jgi:branched-chain amino acid transport system permease protein
MTANEGAGTPGTTSSTTSSTEASLHEAPPRPPSVEDIALGKAVVSGPPARKGGRWWPGPLVALAVFAVMTPFAYTLKLGIVTTLTTVLFYMLVAHGWNLLGGYGGYLNFGIVAFSGTGVYTAALLNNHLGWSMWFTLLPAALAAALVAVPVGLATLRLRGHYFAIFTLALTFLAIVIVLNTPALGGALGVYTEVDTSGGPRALAASFYYALLILVVIATAIAWLVEHSNFGYALRAIREDEDAAAVLGVRTFDVKLRALVLGAALAGLAGGVYAFQTGYIEPTGAFDLAVSLDIVLVCVIGGLGTWQGPVIGAAIVVLLEQWLRTTIPSLDPFGLEIPAEANRLVLGVLLIVFALFARRGIVGLVRQQRGRQISV